MATITHVTFTDDEREIPRWYDGKLLYVILLAFAAWIVAATLS